MGKKHGMAKVKSLSKPTSVFHKSAKKPEDDDTPGYMKGGKSPVARPPGREKKHKKLRGMMI
jgi:hypothetical protein